MRADPATISRAIRRFDDAADSYARSVMQVADLLAIEGANIPSVARLARQLRSQTEHFRASVWPEREGVQ
jgi:hypothetical protein